MTAGTCVHAYPHTVVVMAHAHAHAHTFICTTGSVLNATVPGLGGVPVWVKRLATFPFIVNAEFIFEVRSMTCMWFLFPCKRLLHTGCKRLPHGAVDLHITTQSPPPPASAAPPGHAARQEDHSVDGGHLCVHAHL